MASITKILEGIPNYKLGDFPRLFTDNPQWRELIESTLAQLSLLRVAKFSRNLPPGVHAAIRGSGRSLSAIRNFKPESEANAQMGALALIAALSSEEALLAQIVSDIVGHKVPNREATSHFFKEALEKTKRERAEHAALTAEEIIAEIRTAAAKADQEQKEALAKNKADAVEILEGIRKAAIEAGVSQHAGYFAAEAKDHVRFARYWLIATAVLIGLTAGGAGYLLARVLENPVNYTVSQNIQVAVSKIVLFSMMVSVVVWSGRTYRAHRHNAVVNRHRQNALATFQAFAQATSDEPTRNAVLLQATQCIFSPQQTGYVTNESDPAPASQVLEIVRSVASSKPTA